MFNQIDTKRCEMFNQMVTIFEKMCIRDSIVGNGLPSQLLFAIVSRIDHFSLQFLASFGSAEGGRESFHGVFAANFNQRIFAGHGCGFGLALNLARVGNLRPVAIHQRPVFLNRLDRGARFAELANLLLELFFSNLNGGLIEMCIRDR